MIARNHIGQRIGEHHQRARHSDAVVREARRLHGEGWGYTRIARQLGAALTRRSAG